VAEDLERRAREAEQQEKRQAKAREALLRTEEGLQRTEEGASGYYENEKVAGAGTLPDIKRFLLLGEPYSRFASSNVATIQYHLPRKTLYVQFLRGTKGSKVPGP
jgi:hypothetical protein